VQPQNGQGADPPPPFVRLADDAAGPVQLAARNTGLLAHLRPAAAFSLLSQRVCFLC
jgi:hypothetical protein